MKVVVEQIKKIGLSKKYYIALTCKFLEAALTFAISIFISRSLGPSLKGEFTYIVEVVNILYILFGLGLGQSYATYRRKYGIAIQGVFVGVILVHGMMVVILGLVLYLVLQSTTVLVILGLTCVSVIWSNLTMMAVIEDSITRNVITVVISLIEAITLSILYFTKSNSLSITILIYALTKIVAIIVFFIKYNFKPQIKNVNEINWVELYKIAVMTMIVVLLISINYRIDVVMMKHFTSSYQTGIYSVAGTISNAFLLIPDAFKEVLFGDSAKGKFKRVTYKSMITSIVLSFAIFIVFVIIGKYAINILYGMDYSSSYQLTIVLWFASIPLTIFKILQPIYISIGKQKIAAFFLLLAAVTNIVVNACLIPTMESMGAAIATTVSYSVCGVLFFVFYKKGIESEINE